ncbi:MAG: tRNA (adenosine(37)-N6)-threonylcarbamoyltransferase complex ATPase subunit type 1 TsaE [Treponema sp.]|nr:tRNA (adenosine(37)-N6)-threonylcarbamoyltransferase complex ATPase subunit type 1 TsaE [uncultured Treponema sp.]MBP5587430.1 tRNA (adenosine(37)-N6)-threonylcarbamoyltransferase complex ATPase subunit type 1 TsaE [Treponema sp.]
MKELTFKTSSADETIELGRRIGSMLKKGDIIAMQGTLAAGKTTITKGIAESLGVTEVITSPTFCLISEYEGRMPLYHLDVYRLDGPEDFINLGTDDMLYGNGVSIIEWSEKIMEELPSNTIILKLEPDSEHGTNRTITISNWPYDDIDF